jgi:hypothetical protein
VTLVFSNHAYIIKESYDTRDRHGAQRLFFAPTAPSNNTITKQRKKQRARSRDQSSQNHDIAIVTLFIVVVDFCSHSPPSIHTTSTMSTNNDNINNDNSNADESTIAPELLFLLENHQATTTTTTTTAATTTSSSLPPSKRRNAQRDTASSGRRPALRASDATPPTPQQQQQHFHLPRRPPPNAGTYQYYSPLVQPQFAAAAAAHYLYPHPSPLVGLVPARFVPCPAVVASQQKCDAARNTRKMEDIESELAAKNEELESTMADLEVLEVLMNNRKFHFNVYLLSIRHHQRMLTRRRFLSIVRLLHD